MFTGIIRCVGEVLAASNAGGDRHIEIGLDEPGIGAIEPGASIAVSGVCLTATAAATGAGRHRFEADVSAETLAVTTLGRLARGSRVNIEPSLRLGDSLDGHWVSGHVDGVGQVTGVAAAARSTLLRIGFPAGLGRFIARKGSIAVDGVSLTVNEVTGNEFEVNIVPHTRELTIVADYVSGTAVNLEVDMIARYLDRLGHTEHRSGLDFGKLQEYGFAKRN